MAIIKPEEVPKLQAAERILKKALTDMLCKIALAMKMLHVNENTKAHEFMISASEIMKTAMESANTLYQINYPKSITSGMPVLVNCAQLMSAMMKYEAAAKTALENALKETAAKAALQEAAYSAELRKLNELRRKDTQKNHTETNKLLVKLGQ